MLFFLIIHNLEIIQNFYEVKFGKERPKINELNFNMLSDDVKEGWLEENDTNFLVKVHKILLLHLYLSK